MFPVKSSTGNKKSVQRRTKHPTSNDKIIVKEGEDSYIESNIQSTLQLVVV